MIPDYTCNSAQIVAKVDFVNTRGQLVLKLRGTVALQPFVLSAKQGSERLYRDIWCDQKFLL